MSHNEPVPYLGVTGIVTEADAACLVGLVGVSRSHPLMGGVLVSAKTLAGEPTESRRYPSIHHAAARLDELGAGGVWPVVHFNTRARGEAFARELDDLARVCPAMAGIQLNVVAPDVEVVARFAREHIDVGVILQLNGSSLRGVLDPWDYVARYPGVRYALFDLSGGRGTRVSLAKATAFVNGRTGTVRPGVAGGLGPDAGPLLKALANSCAPFAVDAESGVRVPVDDPVAGAKHQDRLDHDRVRAYVRTAAAALAVDA